MSYFTVEIKYNATQRELTIIDNSIGMSKDDLMAAQDRKSHQGQ